MKKIINSLLISFLMIFYVNSMNVYAKSEFIGLWVNSKNEPVIEFIQGFSPNMGVGFKYEKGVVSNVSKWTLEGKIIKYGWSKYEFANGKIKYDGKNLNKSKKSRKITKTIKLKEQTNKFIDEVTSYYWRNPKETEELRFLKGFSNETGVYNKIDIKSKESKGLGSWSIAKDVFNLDRTIYMNGIITDTYMIFIKNNDDIIALLKGKKANKLAKIELKDLKDKFVTKLTSGEWMTNNYGQKVIYKYRPYFGDLSGVKFRYHNGKYTQSTGWEYSLKTGSLKDMYEYVNAQIQGKFLLLLKEDGTVNSYERSSGEITTNNFANIKLMKVSEKDTSSLRKVLENQWSSGDDTYQFVFKNDTEGYLHEFITYPINISGNSMKIKGWTDSEEVRFYEQEVVFGDNRKSLALNSNQVYLKHVSDEESKKIQQSQKQKAKESTKKQIAIQFTTIEGKTIKVPLPVESLSKIISFSIVPN